VHGRIPIVLQRADHSGLIGNFPGGSAAYFLAPRTRDVQAQRPSNLRPPAILLRNGWPRLSAEVGHELWCQRATFVRTHPNRVGPKIVGAPRCPAQPVPFDEGLQWITATALDGVSRSRRRFHESPASGTSRSGPPRPGPSHRIAPGALFMRTRSHRQSGKGHAQLLSVGALSVGALSVGALRRACAAAHPVLTRLGARVHIGSVC
jgi:hypothetical protein